MLLPPDGELVRRDRAIPGLATLLDPEALVSALRTALPQADLGEARITYVRYKPGMSCLVGYRLEVAGAAVDIHATSHRPEAWPKLRKARERPAVPGPLGPGSLVLEDRAIAVSIFPNDAKLKALLHLCEAETRKKLLRRLVPDRSDLWEGTLRSLRYKPERRYVAQVLDGETAGAVLRVYAEPSYQAARGSARAFRSRGLLRLARRLGRSNRHRCLALEWLPGRVLSEAIADPGFPSDAVTAVGAALAELHAQEPGRLACRTREQVAASLLDMVACLGFVCPALAEWAQELAQRLSSRLVDGPPRPCPIHGDFYAGQVLLAGGIAAILDLDEAVLGEAAADLGNFMAHLESDALRGHLPPDRVEPVKDALLEGYQAATRCPLSGPVELYTAAGLLALAPYPFRQREPDWPERTEALLGRAEALLQDLPGRLSCSVSDKDRGRR